MSISFTDIFPKKIGGGNIGIKQKRLAVHLTQAELAKKLGVGQNTVSQWENGVTSPRFDKLLRIAEALECSVDDLVCKDNSIR